MSTTTTIRRRPSRKDIDYIANGSGNSNDEIGHTPSNWDGITTGSWVELFPASWIPYVQLARLSPPVPLLLIFFPHLFGLLHASVTLQTSLLHLLRTSLILFISSFFLSNAIHGWNDLIDAPIDAQIPRTRNRPIPRGAISPRAAFIFTAANALLGFIGFAWLPYETAWCSIPSIIAHFYYPFSKRHTYFPQVVLGVALQWAVVVGSSALGVREAWKSPSTQSLFVASLLWTVIYDTVYGYQDYDMDLKIGVKSTAVLFGRTWGKPIRDTGVDLSCGCCGGLFCFVELDDGHG